MAPVAGFKFAVSESSRRNWSRSPWCSILARRLSEKGPELHLFRRGLLASLPLALIGFLLILAQPNYSSAATILCITIAMVFVGRMPNLASAEQWVFWSCRPCWA